MNSAEHTRFHRIAGAGLVLVLTGLGIWTLREFLPALVWAAILAIAVWPLYMRTVARTGRSGAVLPLLFTAAIALLFLLPLGLVALELAREARSALTFIEEARKSGIPAPDWLAHLPLGAASAMRWWNQNLSDPGAANDMLQRLGHGSATQAGRQLGSQLLHRVVLFGFTLLALFFLFRDGETLTAQMRRASARAFGPRGERIAAQMIASVHGTVDGLVLVGLGEGFVIGLAYVIAGVPHPVLFGFVTAIAAMVPFGAPVVFGLASLLVLVQGSLIAAVSVFVWGAIVSFVADHFVRPVLIGGTTNLPFLWVLLGILGGVASWGLLGLFLGPALMAALMQLWRDWTAPAADQS